MDALGRGCFEGTRHHPDAPRPERSSNELTVSFRRWDRSGEEQQLRPDQTKRTEKEKKK